MQPLEIPGRKGVSASSKRSKSKEGVGSTPLGVNVVGNGSVTQRNNVEEMKFSQTMNI
jgi:hypothetical protein